MRSATTPSTPGRWPTAGARNRAPPSTAPPTGRTPTRPAPRPPPPGSTSTWSAPTGKTPTARPRTKPPARPLGRRAAADRRADPSHVLARDPGAYAWWSMSTPEADAVIHTEDLTKVYQGTDFAAVNKLNLDVKTGEIFGLLGPNGAGKTTTAGMLTTRVVPTSGRAFIAGVDVAAHPALAKQLSGIVSQQNTLDRQLTVWENLYFHGRLFGMGAKASKQTATQLLEQFQLTRWAKASVYALSGGMAQRLMVARAIFHRPSVLFLDEPTAGLDPQSRLALWDLLGELHEAGQTILLTTHYMEEADRLCQRVAIMDHGRILALDTPKALKQSIGADTIVTIKTTGDAGRLAELLTNDVEGVARTRTADDKIELHMQGADRLVPRIVLAAEREGFDLSDVSIAEPTLETVFISLTGKDLRD